MLPSRYKKVVDAMDFDGDGKVSQEEIDKAQSILEKAKEQEQSTNKLEALNNFTGV